MMENPMNKKKIGGNCQNGICSASGQSPPSTEYSMTVSDWYINKIRDIMLCRPPEAPELVVCN
jgi:hypothetical protein